MPLAFESTSHGSFAFGFFNIRSDMLLLEDRFFFATDFCAWMTGLAARGEEGVFGETWDVWTIDRPEAIGDLMGAIRGIRFTGFIGETYRRHPFPADPSSFAQAPEGDGTQAEYAEMIAGYARRGAIRFEARRETGVVSIGDIEMTAAVFCDLVRYVWRGGYPKWRDSVRPPYVLEMRRAVEGGSCWLFRGMSWEG
jgi:hypothetical protein